MNKSKFKRINIIPKRRLTWNGCWGWGHWGGFLAIESLLPSVPSPQKGDRLPPGHSRAVWFFEVLIDLRFNFLF